MRSRGTPAGEHPACSISHQKRRDASENNVPSEGNAGKLPEVNIEAEAAEHAGYGAALGCAGGKYAEQKDAQQGALSYGRNRQAHFQDFSAMPRQESEAEEKDRPCDGCHSREAKATLFGRARRNAGIEVDDCYG